MSITIKCQKCGTENRLGQIFCRECGEKLDLNAMNPANRARNARGSIDGVKLAVRLVRLAVFLALVGILGLLCWTRPATGEAGDPAGEQRVVAKMTALRNAVLRGLQVTDTVPEADLNGYLRARLAGAGSGSGFLALSLQDVRVDLKPDLATVWMKASLGPLPLTYSTDVTLSRAPDGSMAYSAGDVSIGHLTAPSFLRDRAIRQFLAVFSRLQDEQVILNRLPHVRPVDGMLEAGTMKN